jgi:hypothetical protein
VALLPAQTEKKKGFGFMHQIQQKGFGFMHQIQQKSKTSHELRR